MSIKQYRLNTGYKCVLVSEIIYLLLRKWLALYQDFIPRFHCKNYAEQETIECPKYWKLYEYIYIKFTLNFYYIYIFSIKEAVVVY